LRRNLRSEGLAGWAFLISLFAAAAALSLRIRFRAWPEVLVPSYLCGRGWLLYRDIKVVHAPLSIAVLAAVSRSVGFSARSLRVLGLLPVAAILFALRRHGRGRGWSFPAQACAAILFVLLDFAWDGNAIYPEVFLAALAIPIFSALLRGEDGDIRFAGWLFGAALSIKQPALFAFLFASAWVAFRRRRILPSFLIRAAAVPSAFFLFFLAAGAGRDFLRWTLEVPFVYYRGRTSLGIQPEQAEIVLAGVLPLAALIAIAVGQRRDRDGVFLLGGLAVGFALLAFPHFDMVHLVAAVPLLAVGAGEVLTPGPSPQVVAALTSQGERGRGGRQAGVRIAAIALSILLNAAFLATDTSAGEMSFWSSKEDDEAVARLARLPPAPLFLYGADQNLFIRSERVPPGGLYSNPDLWVHYLVGGLEAEQVGILRAHADTIVLRGRGTPLETPGRRLPAFLESRYSAEAFGPGGIRRLRPRPTSGP